MRIIYPINSILMHMQIRVLCICTWMLWDHITTPTALYTHDDVIKWKHIPRYWPFVRRIHRSPVNSPHKGQWRGALMFSLICVWINDWVNNGEAGNLRRYRIHYDVTVMRQQTLLAKLHIAIVATPQWISVSFQHGILLQLSHTLGFYFARQIMDTSL